MREFEKVASGHPDSNHTVSAAYAHQGAGCQDKRIYTEKIGRLTRLLKKEPVRDWNGNKVILTGILLESEQILKKMESHNLAVLSDYLLQESLQFQTDAPVEGKDSFYRLACRFADLKFCSVAMDPEKSRISRLCEEAIENQAGVIVCIRLLRSGGIRLPADETGFG